MSTVQEKIDVMKAFLDGRKIVFRKRGADYDKFEYDVTSDEGPVWDWGTYEYSVKVNAPKIPWTFIDSRFKWLTIDLKYPNAISLWENPPELAKHVWTSEYGKCGVVIGYVKGSGFTGAGGCALFGFDSGEEYSWDKAYERPLNS